MSFMFISVIVTVIGNTNDTAKLDDGTRIRGVSHEKKTNRIYKWSSKWLMQCNIKNAEGQVMERALKIMVMRVIQV